MKLLEGLTSVIILPLVLGSRWDKRGIDNVYAGAPINNITVSSDNLVQCSEATISWTNTKPPVNIRVGIGGYYVGVDWLATLHSDDDSATWTVDQPSGTSLIFEITDADGELAYVQNQKVQGSDDASCLSTESSETVSTSVEGGAVGPETSGAAPTQDGGMSSAVSELDSESFTSTSSSKSKKSKSSTSITSSTSSPASTAASSARNGVTSAVVGGSGASSTATSSSSSPTASAQSATTSGASSLSVELPFGAITGAVTLVLVGVSVMIWL